MRDRVERQKERERVTERGDRDREMREPGCIQSETVNNYHCVL